MKTSDRARNENWDVDDVSSHSHAVHKLWRVFVRRNSKKGENDEAAVKGCDAWPNSILLGWVDEREGIMENLRN